MVGDIIADSRATSPGIRSLAKVNAELVLDMQCRRPVKAATLDVDATVIA